MTTNEISQTGIESNLINQQMNEMKPKNPLRTDKGKDCVAGDTDTVKITGNISESPAIQFEAIDEEKANILVQLVANDLSRQSFGITTQTGTEALRSFI